MSDTFSMMVLLALYDLGVLLLSSEVFFLSPCGLGVPLFYRMSFLDPCGLGVPIFYRRSFIAPDGLGVHLFLSDIFLAPYGPEVSLFSSDVFFRPLRFRGASFFIRGLFLCQ
jgi:hypothetical protein